MGENLKQLNLFDPWDDPEFLEKICTPCRWYPSLWMQDYWFYQDANGFALSDDFARHYHEGTMLPMKIN